MIAGSKCRGCWRALAAVLLAVAWSVAGAQQAGAADQPPAGAKALRSGLPLPRFVSLKSDRVNLRKGPSTDYPTQWVYRRAGLPLEVIEEFEGWRQVRDAEGTTGWVLQSFLSGLRTALVQPWDVKTGTAPQVPLRDASHDAAKPVVMVEAGVIASVTSCDGRWCWVAIEDFRGYIEQKKLWGVYEGEVVK